MKGKVFIKRNGTLVTFKTQQRRTVLEKMNPDDTVFVTKFTESRYRGEDREEEVLVPVHVALNYC